MSKDECTRPSYGRVGQIGDFYDVRTETLMNSNVFKSDIHQFVKTSFSSSDGFHYEIFESTNTSEKLRKIGINADASLSLMCNLVTASGSVNFVKDQKCNKNAVQCNVVVRKTTKKEHLNYKQSELREYFELSGHEHATHVVVGITWGANATVTYTHSNVKGHDKKKLSQKMSLKLQKINPQIGEISANVNTPDNDTDEDWKDENTRIAVYTDVPPADQSLPQTVQDAKKFIDTIVAEKDGKHQTFHLLPISCLKSYLEMPSNVENKFSSINDSTIEGIESLFDEIDESYSQMKELWGDIENTKGVPRKEKNDFQKRLTEMKNDILKIKAEIRSLVLKVRANEADPFRLDEKCHTFQNESIASRSKFEEFYHSKRNVFELLKFFQEFEKKGAKTAGDDFCLSEIKRNNIDKNTYILFCSFEKERNSDRINTFCKLMNEQKSHDCFVVVDIDTWEGNKDDIPKSATLQLIVDGKIEVVDMDSNTKQKGKQISMVELEKMLVKSGKFETEYSDLGNKTACCVAVDNFTNETLKFENFEEIHGWFVHESNDKNVAPGHRYSFVTRKMGLSWYGPAVMCAWKFNNYLITACWQVPVAGSGYENSYCIGITNRDITYKEISYETLEASLGNDKVTKHGSHCINYFTAAKKSELFSAVYMRQIETGVESETIENRDLRIIVRMTKGPNCYLSIQVFPQNLNNYAANMISAISIK